MKIRLDNIPDAGVDVEITDQKWAQEAAAEALEGSASRLTGKLSVQAYDDHIRVTGVLTLHGRRPCDRCGMDLLIDHDDSFDLHYVAAGSRDSGQSRELKTDELDIGFYDGGAIDLAAVVQEHFALSMPSRLACDAPGTRVADGELCGAPDPSAENEKPVDPRFAVLAGLKLND